jgi:predicted extracellular nuclease
MKKFIFYNFILVLLILFNDCKGQSCDTIVVAFWNLQNLFDTIDDPQKDDQEFLPSSELEWTNERLDKKMYNLARVIRSMNNSKGPDILGVCEVENQAVLESMVKKFLPDLNYWTAYIESPDNRGIDNGLIYKADKFKLLNIQADTVHLSDGYPTRLILCVNLLTDENEKITIFVNHWPSRRGGQDVSEPNRIAAALTLRNAVDRIFAKDIESKIIIIGDFNDDPDNASLVSSLMAHPINCDSIKEDLETEFNKELFNLAYEPFQSAAGSFKFRDTWNLLDQVIVSSALISNDEIHYLCSSFQVYKPEFLVTQSGKYTGTPFPTYGGKRYLGGYSDHFPVIAKFLVVRD